MRSFTYLATTLALVLALTSCGSVSLADSPTSQESKSVVAAVPKSTASPTPTSESSKTKEPLPYETVKNARPDENPLYVIVDGSISEHWGLEWSAGTWNVLADCELFTLDKPSDWPSGAYLTVTVTEVYKEFASDDATGYLGLTEGSSLLGPTTISLNSYFVEDTLTTMHELGHVLGLEHSNDPNSIMYVDDLPTTIEPSSTDISQVLKLNSERCS